MADVHFLLKTARELLTQPFPEDGEAAEFMLDGLSECVRDAAVPPTLRHEANEMRAALLKYWDALP